MLSRSVLCLVGIILVYFIAQKRRRARLPPGPPALPLIGNLHQAPKEAVWLTFQKWVKEYGNLVSVNFGGTTVIIVGDFETAKDLLDKRGTIYSSRPRLVMAQVLVCNNNQIMFKPFGKDFLLHQRLEAPVLSPRASACYKPIQDMESKQLLMNLLDDSVDFAHQIEIFTSSVAYSMAYGLRIHTGKEWQVKQSRECLDNFVIAGQSGVWIVDAIPWLNHLPELLAPWKKTAAKWFELFNDLHRRSFNEALARDGWNWSKEFKNAKEAQNMTEQQVEWDVGILADAGVETTTTTLMILILACVAQPQWVLKAQEELDIVVGSDRLPDFEDIKDLPYIQAVIAEVFRWRHPVPAGVPHATTQDDHYQGYLIPKGSVVIPLFSAMRQDEAIFDNPTDFRPERWLGTTQPGSFGYGRRACSGRHIARNNLAIAIARMLWAFSIRTPDGKPTLVEENMFTTGFVSAPKPFRAMFEPRSGQHVQVIREAHTNTEQDITIVLNGVHEKLRAIGVALRA